MLLCEHVGILPVILNEPTFFLFLCNTNGRYDDTDNRIPTRDQRGTIKEDALRRDLTVCVCQVLGDSYYERFMNLCHCVPLCATECLAIISSLIFFVHACMRAFERACVPAFVHASVPLSESYVSAHFTCYQYNIPIGRSHASRRNHTTAAACQ